MSQSRASSFSAPEPTLPIQQIFSETTLVARSFGISERKGAASSMGIFSFMQANESAPAGARGFRAYVVGDVHGRLDLLEGLLAEIDREIAARPRRKILLVFLGDLIDRGPELGSGGREAAVLSPRRHSDRIPARQS